MPSFIDADCQAIYLGTTRREDLIRAVGRLERHDGAPDKLSDRQKKEISNHPYILEKVKARKSYILKMKEDGYATIKAAKGTLLYKKHHEAQRKINCKRNSLRNELLDKAINNFHETVHVDEVDRQMRGILPDTEVLAPSTIEYQLEERATVAKLLFNRLMSFMRIKFSTYETNSFILWQSSATAKKRPASSKQYRQSGTLRKATGMLVQAAMMMRSPRRKDVTHKQKFRGRSR
jgi:hypothetical protein